MLNELTAEVNMLKIEHKALSEESHKDVGPNFGSCQAKELLDHLESVLANEPKQLKVAKIM
ncbi:trehalose-phosphatase [Vigna unguiculata]|uniref:Trehalose-phosphatase n=1 Tax=Vigna unguiculata TaxID=3917 RepID=A0A4D6L5E1_VIGUN|nr:trehalose-phosphatase [Vigna unguiculata]QCD83724.1 trehalose-phosphatase [Vigna unguiculata]